MKTREPLEKVLWSIAFPGFGQLLNGKYVKGFIFVILEVIINIQANLNQVIIYSFQGDILLAIAETDYQWLMFYPCVYMYAIWDAFRDAGGGEKPYAYFPCVCSAYVGTVGLIYSDRLYLFGTLIGPVFLPIAFLLLGAGIGYVVQRIFIRYKTSTL